MRTLHLCPSEPMGEPPALTRQSSHFNQRFGVGRLQWHWVAAKRLTNGMVKRILQPDTLQKAHFLTFCVPGRAVIFRLVSLVS